MTRESRPGIRATTDYYGNHFKNQQPRNHGRCRLKGLRNTDSGSNAKQRRNIDDSLSDGTGARMIHNESCPVMNHAGESYTDLTRATTNWETRLNPSAPTAAPNVSATQSNALDSRNGTKDWWISSLIPYTDVRTIANRIACCRHPSRRLA